MERLLEILNEIGINFSYNHFAEGENPQPPFMVYLFPSSFNFSADGRCFFKTNDVRLEVYTDFKDLETENKITAVLDKYGIYYEQSETWIDSEKLYEVVFSFSVKGE